MYVSQSKVSRLFATLLFLPCIRLIGVPHEQIPFILVSSLPFCEPGRFLWLIKLCKFVRLRIVCLPVETQYEKGHFGE